MGRIPLMGTASWPRASDADAGRQQQECPPAAVPHGHGCLQVRQRTTMHSHGLPPHAFICTPLLHAFVHVLVILSDLLLIISYAALRAA